MSKPIYFAGLFEHIPRQEKINFVRHLAITIKAGLPLFEALKIIRKQSASKTLQNVIDDMIADVGSGRFLADSLARRRRLFGDFFISIVRIGEESGTLAQNLLYLADEMKKSLDLKRKVRSAMVYPIIISIATLGITGVLTFFVFPKVLPVFSGLKITLPLTTRILIAIFNFLLNDWLVLVVGLTALVLAFRFSLRFWRVKYFFDTLIFYIPVVSSLTVAINVANFTRTMGILLKSGIKIVEAVNITSATFDNLVYRRLFLGAAEEIKKGEQFVRVLTGHKKLFPPLLAGLIEIGENTGNLEENLFYLSEYYAEEVDATVRNLTSLLEPLLLLTMGLVVGFVAISIITPIYEITSNLKP